MKIIMEDIVLIPTDICKTKSTKPDSRKHLEYRLLVTHQFPVITKTELGKIAGIIDHTAVEIASAKIAVVLLCAMIIICQHCKFVADCVRSMQINTSAPIVFDDTLAGIFFLKIGRIIERQFGISFIHQYRHILSGGTVDISWGVAGCSRKNAIGNRQ